MIINAYAVLDAFVSLLRLGVGIALLAIIVRMLPSLWRSRGADRVSRESRYYLLLTLASVGLILNVAAWPLLYLLLQSYVPQWSGVMCIYGVTQIGAGSQGVSGWLPLLLTTLQLSKLLVLLLSGAWFVLHLANRATRRAALAGQVLAALTAFGLATTADAALEGAYLLIPKKEQVLEAGCCSLAVGPAVSSRRSAGPVSAASLQTISRSFLGITALMVGGLIWGLLSAVPAPAALASLAIGAAASAPIAQQYLVHVAAPRILGLPFHHCPYDLLIHAPETAVGVAAFCVGVWAAIWAALARAAGAETQVLARRLLFLSLWGYLFSLVLFSVEMASA